MKHGSAAAAQAPGCCIASPVLLRIATPCCRIANSRGQRGRACRAPRPRSRALAAVPSLGWTAAFFLGPLVLLGLYSFGADRHHHVPGQLGLDARELPPDLRCALPATRSSAASVLSVSRDAPLPASSASPWRSGSRRLAGRRQTLALVLVMIPFWSSSSCAPTRSSTCSPTAGRSPPCSTRWAPRARLAQHPVLADGDRDRHRLLVPAADDPAAVRGARADRPALLHAAADLGRAALAARSAASSCRSRCRGSSPAASWSASRRPAST